MKGGGLEETYHVNFIINMLIRYPEIFTASFDLATSSYNINYLICSEIDGESYQQLCSLLKDNLEALSYFQKRDEHRIDIGRRNYNGLTRIEITVKDKFLAYDEVGLVCRLMRDQFDELLVSEQRSASSPYGEETTTSVEEMLMLFMSRNLNSQERDDRGYLLAFRDSGKVYVYDK